jgi:hypothetical protein
MDQEAQLIRWEAQFGYREAMIHFTAINMGVIQQIPM